MCQPGQEFLSHISKGPLANLQVQLWLCLDAHCQAAQTQLNDGEPYTLEDVDFANNKGKTHKDLGGRPSGRKALKLL